MSSGNFSSTPHERIEVLISQALNAMAGEDPEKAFMLLVEAKKLRVPVRNLDYCRGICFIKLNRLVEAREALREELRYFADNSEARALLEQVVAEEREPQSFLQDQEFFRVYEAIRPYTMLSQQRLYSLFSLAKQVCQADMLGNFVECGVAAGGSSALLAYVIKTYSRQPRLLYSFDSFEGMPEPGQHDSHRGQPADDSGWGTGTCSAPEASLKAICSQLGVADVVFPIKGYFEESLPKNRSYIGRIALLHLDEDWYESTKTILDNLYDLVVEDGLLQVDDYGHWDGCRKAIHEFETSRGLKFGLTNIDGTGVFFRKPGVLG